MARKHSVSLPSGATVNRLLQQTLAEVGEPEAMHFASHDWRRGSAFDVLQNEGMHAMMVLGGWNGRAAFHYVPRDAMEDHLVAEALIGGSDSE